MAGNTKKIEKEIIQLATIACDVFSTAFEGFMQNKLGMLMDALKKEEKLNHKERLLTDIITKALKQEKAKRVKESLIIFTDLISQIERIGDHCADLIERMEIKIAESLFFSEEAVEEYKELYLAVESNLANMFKLLKTRDKSLASEIIKAVTNIKKLTEKYYKNHLERLKEGICDPRAGKMFLDMLDATRSVSFHCSGIAQTILRLK